MKNLFLGLITGLLLYLGWPTSPLTYLLFVAFVPLLFAVKNILEDNSKRKILRVLLISWASFGLFNVIGTWWVKNAHWSGTVATTIVNGFLMAFAFMLYAFASKSLGSKRALFGIPFFWICVEVLHQDWDMSFPWLDLGHGLATRIEWIQWYEYTGHLGGTLWIWVVNIIVFLALVKLNESGSWKSTLRFSIFRLMIWFFVPIAISQYMYLSYEEKGQKANIVVVQPNIDALTEKFELSEKTQLEKFANIVQPVLSDTLDYLVGPETMLVQAINEDNRENYYSMYFLRDLIEPYPRLNLVAGAVSYKTFSESQKTDISRPMGNSGLWYEIYNTGFQLNRVDSIPFYHKSKLVVGAEMMPFMKVLKPLLGEVVLDFGGTSGTHGVQKNREVFVSEEGGFKAGAAICWEAEFGEFMTGYSRNGANLIFAITNDGWWGDTDGHRQHMNYARLRAVESRRSIARSANTGISCFINQRGDVLQQLGWKEEGYLIDSLRANNELTFYAQRGDIIGRIALFLSFFLIVYSIVRSELKKAEF